MSLKATWFRDRLSKKAKRGFQGYPVATIAYYGKDDTRASKVAVGIIRSEGADADLVERWFSQDQDVRFDAKVSEAVVHFIQQHGARTVVAPDRIIGCPHEEGVDYPEGQKCPACPFWAKRDRFTGQPLA
jgi:hypothetical protein